MAQKKRYKEYFYHEKPKDIVTYKSPRGETLNVCNECEDRHWPRDSVGQTFQSVHEGQHAGRCDICGLKTEPKKAYEKKLIRECSK